MAIGDGIRRNIATVTKAERDRMRDAFRKLDDQNDLKSKYADGVTFWDKHSTQSAPPPQQSSIKPLARTSFA